MSHFTVAVLSYDPNDVDDLLAPFDESPSNEEYLEFDPVDEDEYRSDYETGTSQTGNGDIETSFVSYKVKYPTFNAFMEEGNGLSRNDEGAYGYYTNPNAKWDWWVIGGRWDGLLRLKNGGSSNQARVRDVDVSPDPAAYAKAIRFWEVYVEGQPLAEGEEDLTRHVFYKPEYYVNQYGTKEKYAHSQAAFGAWAILTADGEWNETGAMGWFGMSDATQESRNKYETAFRQLIEENPDLYITIVDCHI